jgi:predicted PolB exonuclease-like 3'-5' exonuclease
MDERSHLEGFFAILGSAPSPPRLVSWNGSGFDLPVIRYRSMLLGIASPELYRSSGDWKWNNYQNRYHDMHVDLMDVLSGYGASHRVGLETMSQLLGLPGKRFLEGEVWEHVVRGENELVREYCKLDVVSTLLLYLSWEVHRGELARADLERYVGAVREGLAREPAAGWSEIAAGLAGWPAW